MYVELTEKEFYEDVSQESYSGDTGDHGDFAHCMYCGCAEYLREGENFKDAAMRIVHGTACPVRYARNRLEELKGKD